MLRFNSFTTLFLYCRPLVVSFFKIRDVESELVDVRAQLTVWKLAIKVLVEGHHQLVNLVLVDSEAHTLKHIMELIHLNVSILVLINLIKAVLQCETSLKEHLDQMIEDLILRVLHLTLLVDISQALHIVLVVEALELLELDHTVRINVNFVEKSSDFVILDRKVEKTGEAYVEISQAEEASLIIVHVSESLLHR